MVAVAMAPPAPTTAEIDVIQGIVLKGFQNHYRITGFLPDLLLPKWSVDQIYTIKNTVYNNMGVLIKIQFLWGFAHMVSI
jgi:hypothetical protein